MSSPLWRIRHIYTIQSRDATGKDAGPIPFRPTPEQDELLEDIYVHGFQKIIVVKSRQLGMSTIIAIIMLDSLLFGSGLQCSIVDKKEDDATKKLNGKIKYGYESLDAALRSGFEVTKSNDGEFSLRRRGADQSDQSSVYASVSSRGGTNHILHISEWGETQMKDKRRSLEILTGSLPTADHPGCVTIVETTWKGGKTGELWPLVSGALKMPESAKGPKDWRVRFYGWWTNQNNRDDGEPSQITADTHEYCDNAEKMIGRKLDSGQRLWWKKKKAELGIHMMSEHPTTMDECFEAPHEGAFFDAAGLAWQLSNVIPLEPRTMTGDINVVGNAAYWQTKPDKLSPFRVVEMPVEGESYLIAADFCVGKQAAGSTGERDTHAYGVWKAGSIDPYGVYAKPMMVAMCRTDDRCITLEVIQRIRCLYMLYGQCLVVPEINNMGNICSQLESVGVTNLWTQRTGADGVMAGVGKREEVKGWLTNVATRKNMLDNLQNLVMQQGFICTCPMQLHQLTVFVTNAYGKAEAASGEHDDWCIMTAIGLFCLPSATPYRSPQQMSDNKGHVGFDPSAFILDGRGI